jgi:hypothetical protein
MFLFHFCCDVLHLRDWIAATVGNGQTDISRISGALSDAVIKPSPELSACRDIANGFKHLVLHGCSFVTGTTAGHSEVVSQGIEVMAVDPVGLTDTAPSAPASGSTTVHRSDTFVIDISGQQHDAHDVATKAVAASDQWLAGPCLTDRKL